MSILLNMLKNSRTFVSSPCKTSRMGDGNGGGYSAHDLVRVPPPQSIPYGPFFSKLKKLTITSQVWILLMDRDLGLLSNLQNFPVMGFDPRREKSFLFIGVTRLISDN